MSTRSRIARENADGTITSVYCRWDGYPTGVGLTLVSSYTDPAKIDALLALGSISTLGNEIGEQHDFGLIKYNLPETDPRREWTQAYSRDRGEGLHVSTYANRDHLLDNFGGSWEEYCYLYTGGQWTMYNSERGFEPLLDYLQKMPEVVA